jgi:hypothetical protein
MFFLKNPMKIKDKENIQPDVSRLDDELNEHEAIQGDAALISTVAELHTLRDLHQATPSQS